MGPNAAFFLPSSHAACCSISFHSLSESPWEGRSELRLELVGRKRSCRCPREPDLVFPPSHVFLLLFFFCAVFLFRLVLRDLSSRSLSTIPHQKLQASTAHRLGIHTGVDWLVRRGQFTTDDESTDDTQLYYLVHSAPCDNAIAAPQDEPPDAAG